MSHCGNCSYNCCCSCSLEHCHICRRNICTYERYSKHYICFDCKIAWKVSDGDYSTHDNTLKNVPLTTKYKYDNKNICDNTRCHRCRKDGTNMGWNFHTPKKNDLKSWKLIKKIVYQSNTDLLKLGPKQDIFVKLFADTYNIPYNSLYDIWLNMKLKYDTMHKSQRPNETNQLKIWYPKHKREYHDFLEQIRSTNYIDKDYLWKLLRSYVKIRSIVNYWRRITYKKKVKIFVSEITVLPPNGKNFDGGSEYISSQKRFMKNT